MPDFKTEKALVLSTKRLGERSFIVSLLTLNNGRHLGVLQKKRPPECGTFVTARWQARLSEQLGNFYLEETDSFFILFMDDKKRLACLSSVCALLDDFLPERQSVPKIYKDVCRFLEQLSGPDFLKEYVLWEKSFLSEIGFGLDLSGCAGGGDGCDLAYVSPKTGCAVSREKGLPYHDKLLSLPKFLWQNHSADLADIQNGLRLTGYFLIKHNPKHRLPISRCCLTL